MGNILVKPLAGKSAKTAKSIAAARPVDALFTKSRQRVLTVLFGHPERSFYANEIITLAQVGTGATQRELAALADAGLLTVSKQGKQKHYQANPGSELAAEIYAIVRKTMCLNGVIDAALATQVAKIVVAVAFGTEDVLRDTSYGEVDLLIVSDQLDDTAVSELLKPAATALKRRLAVTHCSRAEFAQLAAKDAAFTDRLQSLPKIWLVGSDAQLKDAQV
jgi:hypothetical protein